MRRKIFATIAVLAVALTAIASGANPKTDFKSIPLKENYSQLIVSAAIDVALSDSVKDIRVYAPEVVMKHLTVEQEGGTLRIAMRRDVKLKLRERPRIVIPTRMSVNYIELRNAASLQTGKLVREMLDIYLTGASTLRGNFEGKRLTIEQAGASDVKAHVAVENIALNLSAASTMEIRGRVFFKMDVSMIEASSLDAEKLEVRRIEGSLDGASNAILWCTERMAVPVRGASHLVYIGRPLVANCPTSDVSTVVHK